MNISICWDLLQARGCQSPLLIPLWSPSLVVPSPKCSMCVWWSVSYSRPDVFGWTTGYILILFIGEEGPKSRALERMGHRVNHHSHVLDQSKQETSWLPLEFDVTLRLVVSWFWKKTLKPGQLYIMFISFYWITVASCDKQWRLKRQYVFSVHMASVSVSF